MRLYPNCGSHSLRERFESRSKRSHNSQGAIDDTRKRKNSNGIAESLATRTGLRVGGGHLGPAKPFPSAYQGRPLHRWATASPVPGHGTAGGDGGSACASARIARRRADARLRRLARPARPGTGADRLRVQHGPDRWHRLSRRCEFQTGPAVHDGIPGGGLYPGKGRSRGIH